jgi:hypothetical protein
MAAHNIYAAQLARLGNGYALWVPEPRLCDEVRVGDVGYLLRGRFHRLFNVTIPASHPLNQRLGVPEGFVHIDLPPDSIDVIPKYFDPGPLHSENITKVEIGVSGDGCVLVLLLIYRVFNFF